MSPWERLLEKPQSRGHFMQLYRPGMDSALIHNVCLYLREGLAYGEAGLAIADAAHRAAILQALAGWEIDTAAAQYERRLVLLDSVEMLNQFMQDGMPDWHRFERAIRPTLEAMESSAIPPRTRAYGEMVNVLWRSGQRSAAARLEQFWNRLLAQLSFTLYCSYAIDVLDPEFRTRTLDSILCSHTHFLPSEAEEDLVSALDSAMDSVLGARAARVRAVIDANQKPAWAAMPDAERAILWLRENLPEQSEAIVALTRTRLATSSQTQ